MKLNCIAYILICLGVRDSLIIARWKGIFTGKGLLARPMQNWNYNEIYANQYMNRIAIYKVWNIFEHPNISRHPKDDYRPTTKKLLNIRCIENSKCKLLAI